MPHPILFPVYFIVNFAFRLFVTAFLHIIFIGIWYLICKGIALFITIPIGFTQLFWDILPILFILYSLGWLIYLIWISAVAAWHDGFDFKFPKSDESYSD